MQIENLPVQLRETGRFCCWRYETRSGSDKPTKVPYNPRTGGGAQSTNPASFAPFSVALETYMDNPDYNGLGVGIFDSLGAIDIDHCIDENGELSDLAADVMETMNAYTEKSPSGHGLRILFSVSAPFPYDKTRYYINNQKLGLEVYIAGCTNKYVTVTGDVVIASGMEDRSQQLTTVLDKYMLRSKPAGKAKSPSQKTEKNEEKPADLDDQKLIELAKKAKNGDAFARLFAGDTSGYDSPSEADMALCSRLAFWTNRDANRMDSLFRKSGLMREKWDRPTAGSTYGAITIQNAIANSKGGYDPQAFQRRKSDSFSALKDGEEITLSSLHPESNRRYGWHDIGNGNLFADWYQNQARYVPERKKWFVYENGVWKADVGELKVMQLCKALADQLVIYALSLEDEQKRQDYLKFVSKWQSRRNREVVLKDAASVYPVSIDRFDRNPYLLNCLNGTLDLQTREFRDHSPADLCSQIANVRYDPDIRSELWQKTIADVMQNDESEMAFLQKAMGYGLTGVTSEECFFILYGPTTRNGKGTVMETYISMLGDYGRTSNPDTIAQKYTANSNGPSEDIARLSGARVVNISEPGKQMVLSASLVKTLTGSDTVTARFLNENSFEFVPQFKLFVNTNHLPRVTDVTIFNSGRVKVIPFKRHFSEEEQDKSLKQKLSQPDNLSGILNWCLEGLWLFQETGLDLPPSVQNATDSYRHDSDKIGRFIDEMMVQDAAYEVSTKDAYKSYQDWCHANGQEPEGLPVWRQAINCFFQIRKKRPSGAGKTVSPQSTICGAKLVDFNLEHLRN